MHPSHRRNSNQLPKNGILVDTTVDPCGYFIEHHWSAQRNEIPGVIHSQAMGYWVYKSSVAGSSSHSMIFWNWVEKVNKKFQLPTYSNQIFRSLEKFENKVELEWKNKGLGFFFIFYFLFLGFFSVLRLCLHMPHQELQKNWMSFFIPCFFHRIPSHPVLSFLTLSMPAIKFWFQEHLPVFTPNLSKYGRSLPLKYSQIVFYSITLYRYKKVLCGTLKSRFLKEKRCYLFKEVHYSIWGAKQHSHGK